MSKIKKNYFRLILFVSLIIGNIASDYFELKGSIFSLDYVLRFGIVMLTYAILLFLVSKIIYIWNKNKNNNINNT